MEMRDREDARLERCYDVPIYFTLMIVQSTSLKI